MAEATVIRQGIQATKSTQSNLYGRESISGREDCSGDQTTQSTTSARDKPNLFRIRSFPTVAIASIYLRSENVRLTRERWLPITHSNQEICIGRALRNPVMPFAKPSPREPG